MTSRRPMVRTYSGSGRTSSFSEEEGSSSNGRSESRNTYLSNVRPENRSTLCSVMAQLTEDIQPSFDTTLKSKAVSENCNVKFTCVVSGYPAPELKWYKDDMEMDRYCGLPKYEIRRNGKTHTLHIYNCTLDDAAIYQVSASNSKGIVSCSGVLEVGTMNEFQIHQRFFAKLKQKAEKKKSTMEAQAKKEDKENVQEEKPKISPERPPRKRHVPTSAATPAVKKPEALEKAEPPAGPNRVSAVAAEVLPVAARDSEPDNEKSLAPKKTKISNGVVEDGVNGGVSGKNHALGNGGENCYDGGFSLAQFLAEALQSQGTEEKQNPPQVENSQEMDTSIPSADKEETNSRETIKPEGKELQKTQDEENERQRRREEDMAMEKEAEKQTVKSNVKYGSDKHHSKAHKDQDHHNIQHSISSMLHSVKDFLFGKNKKDSHDHPEKKDREVEPVEATQAAPPELPPSFRIKQGDRTNSNTDPPMEDVVPMETEIPEEPSKIVIAVTSSVSLGTEKDKNEGTALDNDMPPAHKLPRKGSAASTGQSVKEAEDAVESAEVPAGPGSSCPGEEMPLSRLKLFTEVKSEREPVVYESPERKKIPDSFIVSEPPATNTARRESPQAEGMYVLPQAATISEDNSSPTPSFVSVAESWSPIDTSLSVSESHSLLTSPTESLQDEDLDRNDSVKKGEPDTEMDHSSINMQLSGKEEAKVKSVQEQLGTDTHEVSKIGCSLEEGTESCEPRAFNQVPVPVSTVTVSSLGVDAVKEDNPPSSTIQETHVGLPPIVATACLEEGDLKIQEVTSSKAELSREAQKASTPVKVQNPVILEDERKLKDGFVSVVIKDVERKSSSDERVQKAATLEVEEAETADECSQVEVKEEKNSLVKEEKITEAKELLVKPNQEDNTTALRQNSGMAQHDNSQVKPSLPVENIPIIEISTIEDIPAKPKKPKPTEPEEYQKDTFKIPKIEIMEPDLKECTLPLTILAFTKQTESTVSQKHDMTHALAQLGKDQRILSDSPSLPPTEEGIPDETVSPVQEVKMAEPSNEEKAERTDEEQEQAKIDEKPPQMDYGTIPVISVSCTDDKSDDVHVESGASTSEKIESPTAPLCVVSLDCATSLESDPALNAHTLTKTVETETSTAAKSGTKIDFGDGTPLNPERAEKNRKQNPEDLAEKSVRENKSAVLHKPLTPKVGDNGPSFSKPTGVTTVPDLQKNNLKEARIETSVSVEDLLRNFPSVERLSSKPPTHPSLSPASLRKFMSKAAQESDSEAGAAPGTRQGEKGEDDLSGGSTPTSSLSCESSPRMKRRDSLTLIRSATPEELASGARRKIFMPKPKEDVEGVAGAALDTQGRKESPYMSPGQARRAALLQAAGQNTPPMERRSPLLNRRKVTLEVPKFMEEPPAEDPAGTKQDEKPAEKKRDPLKAPQVIRKIRGEPFPDASGHLKLWCQFFNVLSDATIKWCKDEEEILQVNRSGGDETQVALAIVLASSQDCGVYSCTINNEYGTDTTDFLLSIDVLSNILLKDDLEVGEEIEMTPLLFTKGLADSGTWGDKYFGRIMTETVHIGEGCAHKTSRVRVIYGLDPIFESGAACVIKVQNPIAYGTKKESNLAERNGQITKQECKVQNLIREYCKIFAAEARLIDNFGQTLEVIPQYLMYRPANAVPYATVEADLQGVYLKYCTVDQKGTLITGAASEFEQKSCAFQHWIHQWTHGNLLVTHLEGVETKITNVRVVTKSKGYQGLTECGSPDVFERFLTQHQCNYFCGLLGLKPLKTAESLQAPTRVKGSRSPLLNRKLGSSSPQTQRKAQSPQTPRKANSSPKVTRKTQETEDNKSGSNSQPAQESGILEIR